VRGLSLPRVRVTIDGRHIQIEAREVDNRPVQANNTPGADSGSEGPTISLRDAVEALTQAMIVWDQVEYGHARRTADYAAQIAAEMGILGERAEHIRIGALLHDIGKIGLDLALLRKPGKLDADETEFVHLHPGMGASILQRVLPAEVVGSAGAHHEQPDGRGYPAGLADPHIPIGAAICRVADVLDSLTTAQTYRGALDLEGALDELRAGAGTLYNRAVVDALLAVTTGRSGRRAA